MVERLVLLKPWQIIVLGLAAFAASLLLVTLAADLCYDAFPAAWGAVAIGHLLAAGLVGWFVPKPFIAAWWVHVWASQRPPLDVFEEEK